MPLFAVDEEKCDQGGTSRLTWQRDKKCFACHSNYTFLETRPLISWKTPVHDELRAKLEELAANPRQVSFRVMEGVMAACVLAQNDALTTGKRNCVCDSGVGGVRRTVVTP